jgi:hypothetical protein
MDEFINARDDGRNSLRLETLLYFAEPVITHVSVEDTPEWLDGVKANVVSCLEQDRLEYYEEVEQEPPPVSYRWEDRPPEGESRDTVHILWVDEEERPTAMLVVRRLKMKESA